VRSTRRLDGRHRRRAGAGSWAATADALAVDSRLMEEESTGRGGSIAGVGPDSTAAGADGEGASAARRIHNAFHSMAKS